ETVAEDVANEAIPSTPTPLILPSPPSHDIPSTSQVQSSPPQQPQSLPQAPPQCIEFPTHLFQQVLDTCSSLTRHVKNLEHDKAAQKLEIIKLKARVKGLERANKVKSSKLRRLKKFGTSQRIESSDDIEDVFNQGRMIDDLDKDEGIELTVNQVKDADTAETEGRHAAKQAEKQAEIYHLDLDHLSKALKAVTAATSQVSATSATISAAKPKINKDIDWDSAIDHVKQKSKENQYIKRYQVMKKRPQIETQKVAKRRKLNEEAQEVEDLKKHLEAVNDEDDDVFTEATPLARKVPVVDYHIVLINSKHRFKIIKADETHQLYITFIILLKNFDREDLEDLWGIVKERFSTSKPSNFSNEYLLTTLKTMFKKPDGQDAVWKSQRSVHGQVLVKR
nr:hypothetical protein [Tanacetum cinerariifolium]